MRVKQLVYKSCGPWAQKAEALTDSPDDGIIEPRTLKEALSGPQADHWRQAVDEEYASLVGMGTWTVGKTPYGVKPLGVKWVFKLKRDAQGNIARYKARLVAQGFSQVKGINYEETFAPVSKHSTLRTLLAVAAHKDMHIIQMDIKTAFLNGDIDEEIYIRQPEGKEMEGGGLSCRLHKALYGLKQAPRKWFEKLNGFLISLGFKASHSDPTCYIGKKDGELIYLLTYVDDLMLFGTSLSALHCIRDKILAQFTSSCEEAPTRFLGIEIHRDMEAGTIKINQRRMILDMAVRHGQDQARATYTPLAPGTALIKLTDTSGYAQYPLAEVVGELMHVGVCTRPDIMYAVGMLARHSATPDSTHWHAAMHVIRYLKTTADQGLTYCRGQPSVPFAVSAQCDSDYAGDLGTRRSTTGFLLKTGGAAITWSSRLQPTVAVSTAEAEYQAAAAVTKEVLWMRKLLQDLQLGRQCLAVGCDNQAALALLKNPLIGLKTKHIDVAHHFVRERVAREEISFHYVATAENAADVLTKPLTIKLHKECMKGLGIS